MAKGEKTSAGKGGGGLKAAQAAVDEKNVEVKNKNLGVEAQKREEQ